MLGITTYLDCTKTINPNAQVVGVVKTHKAATAFLSNIQRHGTSRQRGTGGQAGWQSNRRAGWISIGVSAGIQPFCLIELEAEGFAKGLAKRQARCGLSRGPTV